MPYYYTYCPKCGTSASFKKEEITKCIYCGNEVKIQTSKYTNEYYIEKSIEKYDTQFRELDILEEEIKANPQFDVNAYNTAKEYKRQHKTSFAFTPENTTTPKCPVCQSPNIKKLSATNRGLHLIAFGVASKTARSQFVCRNCGYKF